jgi:hypothetical protein
MASPTPKSSLSPQRRQLFEIMQRLQFGRIEGLHVSDGEPAFDPPPRITEHVMLGSKVEPRSESASLDFSLKRQAVELCEHLTRLRTGTIELIEFRHGLPLKIVLNHRVSDAVGVQRDA